MSTPKPFFEYNPENVERMERVIGRLEGSCDSVDNAIELEFGDDVQLHNLDRELLRLLDDTIGECYTCGWWAPISEIEDDECEDCRDV